MIKITIENMLGRDFPKIMDIYQQGIKTNIATFQTTCPSFEDWDKAHMKACRFVAKMQDKIVGWLALSCVANCCIYFGVAEISIYIDNNAKRLGVGSALLQKVLKEAQLQGLWTLQSSIIEQNIASIKLHQKCGFRVVGFREKIAKDALGNWQNTILMEYRNNVA